MEVSEIVDSAKGTIWGTALRADQEGYVPPGVIEWASGQPPIEYLEDGEQPHFMGVDDQGVLKVEAGEDVAVEASSRVPLDKIQQGIMNDGQTGYLYADEPYPNILFVTDRRLLLYVGKERDDVVVTFRYGDENVTALTSDWEIQADGLEYELGVEFHRQERTQAVRYLHEETSLTVPEMQPQTESRDSLNDNEERVVDRHNLVSLTPEGFEAYVADVWRAQGYSCKLTKGSGDGGIDIIAVQGNDRVLIQAKRYSEQNVGIETVQRTAGLLVDDEFDASTVVIATTSGFTNDAKQRARRIHNLELIDGTQLVALSRKLGIGIDDANGNQVYAQEATPEQVLDVLSSGEPLSTSEIVSMIDAPPRSVVAQLKSLLDDGEIQAKQVGKDRTVWYKKGI